MFVQEREANGYCNVICYNGDDTPMVAKFDASFDVNAGKSIQFDFLNALFGISKDYSILWKCLVDISINYSIL